jgi:hypothetical protein
LGSGLQAAIQNKRIRSIYEQMRNRQSQPQAENDSQQMVNDFWSTK